MSRSRTLTAAQLTDAGATQEQVDAFVATFGQSVEITAQFVDDRLSEIDPDVLALTLSEEAKRLYETARDVAMAAGQQAEAAAQAAFEAAVGPGRVTISVAIAQSFAHLYMADED